MVYSLQERYLQLGSRISWSTRFGSYCQLHGWFTKVPFKVNSGSSLTSIHRTDTFRSTQLNVETNLRKGSVNAEDFSASSLARKEASSPSKPKNVRGPNDRPPPTPNFSLSRNKSSSPTLKSQNVPLSTSLTLETLKDCLHICLKCFKTLLNNQVCCGILNCIVNIYSDVV